MADVIVMTEDQAKKVKTLASLIDPAQNFALELLLKLDQFPSKFGYGGRLIVPEPTLRWSEGEFKSLRDFLRLALEKTPLDMLAIDDHFDPLRSDMARIAKEENDKATKQALTDTAVRENSLAGAREVQRARKIAWRTLLLIVLLVIGGLFYFQVLAIGQATPAKQPAPAVTHVYYPAQSSQTTQIMSYVVNRGYTLVAWTANPGTCNIQVTTHGYDARTKQYGVPVSNWHPGLTKFSVAGSDEGTQVALTCKGPLYTAVVPTGQVSAVFQDFAWSAANKDNVTLTDTQVAAF